MQIMPSGAAWTNPAALNQQALSDSKHAAAAKDSSNQADIAPLEQTGKASDRDANERYDGPRAGVESTRQNPPIEIFTADSLLSLPAADDGTSVLDLLG